MGLSDLERQDTIAQILKERKKVTVTELAEKFGISESSVRRDLLKLERKGQAKKVYGGAIVASSTQQEFDYNERLHRNIGRKSAIASFAVSLVKPGQALLLDSGTTALQIAQRLPEGMGITVVTNGLAIAEVLSGRRGMTLFLLGGRYRPSSRDLVGPTLIAAINQFSVDIAFLSVDGFHPVHGLSTTDHELAEVVQAAMSIAEKKVVVSDSSKGGHRGFASICPINEVDMIISDKHLDKELCDEIIQAGTEVVLV